MPPNNDDPRTRRLTQAVTEALCVELDLDPQLALRVSDPVLGTVGRVAHASARPAGALSAFLAGIAVGRALAPGAQPREHDVLAVLDQVGDAVDRLAARGDGPDAGKDA